MNIYFDGSGWNGKTSAYAVVCEDGSDPIVQVYSEKKTNNEMEYEGALAAARIAEPGDTLITDSQLVEGQLNKGWKVNFEHLQVLRDRLAIYVRDKQLTLVWVPRNENKAGKLFE